MVSVYTFLLLLLSGGRASVRFCVFIVTLTLPSLVPCRWSLRANRVEGSLAGNLPGLQMSTGEKEREEAGEDLTASRRTSTLCS